MTYSDRLKHWVIVRLLPKMQRVVIERFHRRADADGHLQFLQQRIPAEIFIVVFDVTIASDSIQKDS